MKRITIRSTLGTLLFICFIIIILSGKNCDECFSTPVMMIKFIASGLVLLIGGIYFTQIFLRNEKRMFNVETLPLLETNEAVVGVPFCCEGTVVADKVLTAPYSEMPCVYHHSITEEYVKRGKSSEWVIRENIVNYVPFYIEDKRGKIKVDLTNIDSDLSEYDVNLVNKRVPDFDNSEIDCTAILKHAAFSKSETYLGFIPGSRRLRKSEYILIPKTKVFVHGYVSRNNNELVVHENLSHPLIISQKTKEAYIEDFYKGRHLVFFVHVLIAVGFTLSIWASNYFFRLHSLYFYNILFIGNWLIVGSIFFTMYNRLITLKNRALTALSNIDIELKRRSDLIPQIVTMVKQYSIHEKELQAMIAEMRAETYFEKGLSSGKNPTHPHLLAIAENYPTLKASENFRSLMRSLVDTEERLTYSRQFYNRNVRKLNTLVTQFPFIIIASLFSIKHMDFLTIAHDEKAVPKVSLSA